MNGDEIIPYDTTGGYDVQMNTIGAINVGNSIAWGQTPVTGRAYAFGAVVTKSKYWNQGPLSPVRSLADCGPRGTWFEPWPGRLRCGLIQVGFTPCLLLDKPQEVGDVRLTWTDCDEAGDYVVSNVLSARDLASRLDNINTTILHTSTCTRPPIELLHF